MRGPVKFKFLGIERKLTNATDWNNPIWPKLWLYNLHYFDDLRATDASERLDWHRDLIQRWITENPPGRGNGWEPYPTSLRIVNWIKWALGTSDLGDGGAQSLAAQIRWLERRVEYHLLGNHVWANAKALIFGGVFFAGTEANRWQAKGLKILRREIEEQVLADGGHFERSPMYHGLVLEDVLDLVQLSSIYHSSFATRDVSIWRSTAERMLHWLHVMTHPDGKIALFNDAVFGPPAKELTRYARMLGIPVDGPHMRDIEALQHSGYVRLQSDRAVLILDVGEIGPDYIPGHAHADTLSFELSLDSRRVLVNGGTSTYEESQERLRQRGTAAHNTVVVDGENSSEVWASFRVARRARPFDVGWRREGETLVVEGAHDGYRRLQGRVVHRRRWRLGPDRMEIEDQLEGTPRHATGMYHVHPGLDVLVTGERTAVLRGKEFSVAISVEGAKIEVLDDHWHPEFGKSIPSKTLALHFAGRSASTNLVWG